MLKFIVPQDKQERKKQIKALEYAIAHDTDEKDKLIHTQALKKIKNREEK